jgi:heme A synthase
MHDDLSSPLLRRLALACAALMLVVVASSAWLRLTAPREACADWPACRVALQPQRMAPAVAAAGPVAGTAAVRLVHRTTASLVLLLVLAMGVLATRSPVPRGVRPLLAVLAALALGLAALGVATPGSRSSWVLLGNLLGGFAMLALAWTLFGRLRGATALPPAAARLAAAAAALWFAQAALGAVSGSPPASGTYAPQLHLMLAVVAVPLTWGLGRALCGGPRRGEGWLLLALVPLQVLLGFVAAAGQAPTVPVALHNAVAACGAALLVSLARGSRAP